MAILRWGTTSSEAPYYLVFRCYPFPRKTADRASLTNPIVEIFLPGVFVTRGASHRYSEDAPMMENVLQALSTIGFETPQGTDASASEVLNKLDEKLEAISKRYSADAFGQITSSLGRLELLTTETGFLGSSKRKYNFNFNLKSTGLDAQPSGAAQIANTFEVNSMPVAGDKQDQGDIALATRMRPPNIWTIGALNSKLQDEKNTTSFWLGEPKPCVLMNVVHALDNQSFIVPGAGANDGEYVPFSYNIVLNFVELENAMNVGGQIKSRSEFFIEDV